MKEWQELLNYIDLYIYDFEKEEIVIKADPRAEKARKVYDSCLSISWEKGIPGTHTTLLWMKGTVRWEFDIALDCVRTMDKESSDYIKNNTYGLSNSSCHFGYGMGIRNKYIYNAQKNTAINSDDTSSTITMYVFSIVNPFYDFRNGILVDFLNDLSVERLQEMYRDKYAEVFDKIIDDIVDYKYKSSIEAIDNLIGILRDKLGLEEFTRLFKDAVDFYNTEENESNKKRMEWYWENFFPSTKAILYKLQAKQMNILRRDGFFDKIKCHEFRRPIIAANYIYYNYGFEMEHCINMAECAFKIFYPEYEEKRQRLKQKSIERKRRVLERAKKHAYSDNETDDEIESSNDIHGDATPPPFKADIDRHLSVMKEKQDKRNSAIEKGKRLNTIESEAMAVILESPRLAENERVTLEYWIGRGCVLSSNASKGYLSRSEYFNSLNLNLDGDLDSQDAERAFVHALDINEKHLKEMGLWDEEIDKIMRYWKKRKDHYFFS